jgi:hypothetical protein
MSNFCVNKKIEKFNRKVRLRLGRLRKVEMIDVVHDRNLYTRHGQHLNTEGKETMAKKIASTIECVLNKSSQSLGNGLLRKQLILYTTIQGRVR